MLSHEDLWPLGEVTVLGTFLVGGTGALGLLVFRLRRPDQVSAAGRARAVCAQAPSLAPTVAAIGPAGWLSEGTVFRTDGSPERWLGGDGWVAAGRPWSPSCTPLCLGEHHWSESGGLWR